ncbi:MAG: hypothetical protein ORN98_06435, partial [Alphaproteobacteria bacterium]|nr:hypothetical protein [Alphaproteobacteria bacterium]
MFGTKKDLITAVLNNDLDTVKYHINKSADLNILRVLENSPLYPVSKGSLNEYEKLSKRQICICELSEAVQK